MTTLRSLLPVLLCFALSACSLLDRTEIQSTPAPPQTQAVQGFGRALVPATLPAADALGREKAKQRAFAAALVDGLGKAVPAETRTLPGDRNGGELTILSGSGTVEGFQVLRQQVLLAGRPVDDVTVAVRQGRVLVARNGLLVRLDPGLEPLFPAHTQDSPRFGGLAVRDVRFSPFGDPAGSEVICRVRLIDPNLAVGLADSPLPAPTPQDPTPQDPAAPTPVEYQGQPLPPGPALEEADIPFDALVVDARQCELSPSRQIRLLSPDDKELYDPGMVDPGILVERGPAGFTTTYEKALVILSAWEAGNPLTVRCERTAGPGEIVLSAVGAEALVQADAQGGFLRLGRVVVLLPGDQAMP